MGLRQRVGKQQSDVIGTFCCCDIPNNLLVACVSILLLSKHCLSSGKYHMFIILKYLTYPLGYQSNTYETQRVGSFFAKFGSNSYDYDDIAPLNLYVCMNTYSDACI